MTVPRRVLAVIAALALLAAVLGFVAGRNVRPTETAVIEAGAALYVAETGGERSECVGVPGRGAVWIEVRCGDSEASKTYLFDERGSRLAPSEEPRT